MNFTQRVVRKVLRNLFDLELMDNKSNFIIPRHVRRKNDFLKVFNHGKVFFERLSFSTSYSKEKSILDVGCGDGVVAAAFARANHVGLYHGFDINKKRIKYLTSAFLSRPNFRFSYADIYHSYYNDEGSQKPENYKFEIPDARYDIIFLNSVFSHMRQDVIANYLVNCKKFLAEDGEIYATMCTFEEDFDFSKAFEKRWHAEPEPYFGSLTFSPSIPEQVLAHPKGEILRLINESGLSLSRFIGGRWYHKLENLEQHGQDVFILKHK